MLPRDCFPKIGMFSPIGWSVCVCVYIYRFEGNGKRSRDYIARWKNARRADCFVDLKKRCLFECF